MNYASGTKVTETRSRAELEKLLAKFGADEFGYVTRRDEALIGFMYRNIRVQMSVPLPDRDDAMFTSTATGRKRADAAVFADWQREVRRRWRSLCLVIKALLVGVSDGVLTFEQAFLSYIVMGDGLTIYQHVLPHIQTALTSGQMPSTLKQLEALPPEAAK